MAQGLRHMSDESQGFGEAEPQSIRTLLRKHFPAPSLPPKPELPRPLFTGVVDFKTYEFSINERETNLRLCDDETNR